MLSPSKIRRLICLIGKMLIAESSLYQFFRMHLHVTCELLWAPQTAPALGTPRTGACGARINKRRTPRHDQRRSVSSLTHVTVTLTVDCEQIPSDKYTTNCTAPVDCDNNGLLRRRFVDVGGRHWSFPL